MNILLFGATGMVGECVLRWLVKQPEVSGVVAVTRREMAFRHPKLETVIESDMFELRQLERLRDFHACFFCLGTSSVGMSAAEYRRVTYDLTLAVAHQLLPQNPRMVFEYISGEGTDANSRQGWARVKAETENALRDVGFRDVYALRPGFIQPPPEFRHPKGWVRVVLAATTPIYPFLQKIFSRWMTSSDRLAAAMLTLAGTGSPKKTLDTRDINGISTGNS